MVQTYEEIHNRSLADPEAFWAEAAEAVHWYKRWDKVLDDSNKPFYRWFTGAEINTCYNAVDIHCETGRADQLALIYDSPVTESKNTFTYAELRDAVALFAGVLVNQGVTKGDRVIIYMPMIAEAVIAMLACARIGAVHSVVFGGFASNELAVRIDDATPDVIVCASCGVEPSRVVEYKPLVDEAISLARHKVQRCVVLQRPMATASMIDGRDVDWEQALSEAAPQDCVPVAATDPHGGHVVALKWSMKNIYGVEPGETYWAASDVGWVVGHSYITYAPLFHGCTSIVFEGKPVGTPDPGVFWRIISEYDVKVLFTAPTAFRAIKKEDPDGEHLSRYDLSGFRALFLAGERLDRLDPDTLHWAEDKLGVPVIDHWWQTETGWTICSNYAGIELFPTKKGSSSKPAPGWKLEVLDDDRNPVAAGEIGALVAKLPLPPGTFPTLWNASQRHFDAYLKEFPGYYQTSDAGYIDEDGYVFVMARTDDIINVAGHRLSTGAMEEVLADHPDVAECAVCGIADKLKGQIPVGFLVLNSGVVRTEQEITQEVVAMVRERIGPVAAFKQAAIVARLPKTRSGKILRGTMRKIADGEAWTMPATIDDPVILDEITTAMQGLGLAANANRQ